jgi:hypothetical protein
MQEKTVMAFSDELEKIGGIPIPYSVLKLKNLGYLKYPLAMAGGVLGWEQLKKLKRRHDIGRAYEQQLAGRG